MIQLLDPAQLPAGGAAEGPQSWGEAWRDLASASDETQRIIENTSSDRDLLEEIYNRRIGAIESLTGQRLENPIRTEVLGVGVPGFLQPFAREAYRSQEDEFNARAAALADRYPSLSGKLFETVDEEKTRLMKAANERLGSANSAPELGTIGRFTAALAGGLMGAARDPEQWKMAAVGGGGAEGLTVAGRIGRTIATEALLNGGQELVLQAASQERKRAAGLENGMGDMLANAGIAATFGALFGGTVQGGAELARIYRLGKGGEAVAARVLDGRPEPGDVEVLAKGMGVELGPDKLDLVNRSFEERVLDEVMISRDASPAQLRVLEAAERYAADPDNFPPPDVVERMVAEEEAQRLLTLSADDYERVYGGDPNAIDDIADTFFASDMNDATRRIDAAAMRTDAPSVSEAARPMDPVEDYRAQIAELPVKDVEDRSLPDVVFHGTSNGEFDAFDPYRGEYGLMGGGSYFTENPTIALEYTKKGKGKSPAVYRAKVDIRNPIDMDAPADIDAWMTSFKSYLVGEDANGNPLSYAGFSNEQMYREVEEALSQDMIPDWEGSEIMQDGLRSMGHDGVTHVGGGRAKASKGVKHRVWIAFDPEQVSVVGRDRIAVADPIDGASIRPAVVAEPLDDAAMVHAEDLAGDIVEPARDANGNPENFLDFMGVEDGDGNVKIMSALEAINMADEGNMLADLMEACKL